MHVGYCLLALTIIPHVTKCVNPFFYFLLSEDFCVVLAPPYYGSAMWLSLALVQGMNTACQSIHINKFKGRVPTSADVGSSDGLCRGPLAVRQEPGTVPPGAVVPAPPESVLRVSSSRVKASPVPLLILPSVRYRGTPLTPFPLPEAFSRSVSGFLLATDESLSHFMNVAHVALRAP